MHISKSYITVPARKLKNTSLLAARAYDEIELSINNMIGDINNSTKNCNGVVPVKEGCYQLLEEKYGWYREKPLNTFSEKGGPIDVYKEFESDHEFLRVGLEFETGNISSAHRSMNKLALGIRNNDLDFAVLMMPIHDLSYFLTDRVSNYEELEPYYPLVEEYPFIFLGFDAENYGVDYPLLPKGRDGMSDRAIHKWKDKK
jgi:hypothetical protein